MFHTLGLPGSQEEEGAARGYGDDGDGDGHCGLDALPLQEIHGCVPRPPSVSLLGIRGLTGMVWPRGSVGGF